MIISKKLSNLRKILFTLTLFLGISAFLVTARPVSAAQTGFSGNIVYYKDVKVGKKTAKNTVTYIPSSDGDINYGALTYLLSGDTKRKIVIPKGTNMYINGPLRPGNNKTIIATGAKLTFKHDSNAIFTEPTKHVKNLTIKGGVWRSKDKYGRTGSLFVFAFADHVVLDSVDCNANYIGHSVEIIASTNVTVKNCTISALGKNPANCLEEQIQIDLATKKTAPKIAAYGKAYAQGQTCKNVYILNNKVKGARPVGVNWTYSENNKWINKFHENIVIKNNTLTGTTSEALTYFNCIGGEISGNKCVTKATRSTSNGAYTVGIHVAIFGKVPSSQKNKTLKIANNTVYGKRNGIQVRGYYKNGNANSIISKYQNVVITGNKAYCKTSVNKAIEVSTYSCAKLKSSGNKTGQWK